MAAQTDFIAWASSPDRTLEEAYCAERLVEQGFAQWCLSHRHPQPSRENQAARANKRRLNPAHRAKLDRTTVIRAAGKLAAMTCLSIDAHNDRPLRDISALRFFPQLRTLSLFGHEFSDISVLRVMPALESISLSSDELEDFSPLAAVTTLKSFHVYARQPWPALHGLEGLTELEAFHWSGNLLPLEGIPRLGKVRTARILTGVWGNLPLRDATRLPEMPWLEELELDGVHRLDGITRWPRLRNLTVGGPFKDLGPLTRLRNLTHLVLKGEVTRDLSPIAQLPELRSLTVQSQRPQDYSVLAETPRLHEVIAQGCKINKMELATLHAVLAPWTEEFAVTEPRPLARARFVACDQKFLPTNPRAASGHAPPWHDDRQMLASESGWFEDRLNDSLNELFGRKDWGRAWSMSSGMGWISLRDLEAAEQLAVIVETTRRLLASTALPWYVHLAVDLDEADRDRGGEEEENAGEEQAVQREIDEYKDHQKKRREEEEYLEREHRMRLLAQEGKVVNPEEFAVEDDTGTFSPGGEPGEETAGLVGEQGQQPPTDQIWMQGVITEEGLFADERGRAAAEHLMGRKAEDAAA